MAALANTQLRNLLVLCGLPARATLHNLPAARLRREEGVDFGSAAGGRLIKVLETLTLSVAQLLYPIAAQELVDEVRRRHAAPNPNRQLETLRKRFKRTGEHLFDLYTCAKRGSPLKSFAQATLAKCFRTEELGPLLERNNLSAKNGRNFSIVGYKKWNSIIANRGFDKPKTTRQMVSDQQLRTLVRFMLGSDNISPLSWGTSNVKLLGGHRVKLPNLMARRTKEAMCKNYKRDHPNGVSRSTFFRVAQKLIHRAPTLMKAIDYVSGILVDDTVAQLQEVIVKVLPMQFREQATKDLELVANFLKVQYDGHIEKSEDTVSTHSLKYALTSPTLYAGPERAAQCTACNFPFYFLHKFQSLILEHTTANERGDSIEFIEACTEKFQLYQGHRARVVNQKAELERLVESLKTTPNRALIIIDWKMKFEALRRRGFCEEGHCFPRRPYGKRYYHERARGPRQA